MKFRRQVVNYRKNPTEYITYSVVIVEPVELVREDIYSNHPSHKCLRRIYRVGRPADGWLDPDRDGFFLISVRESWADRDEEWFYVAASFSEAEEIFEKL